jgi:hypothetical protein
MAAILRAYRQKAEHWGKGNLHLLGILVMWIRSYHTAQWQKIKGKKPCIFFKMFFMIVNKRKVYICPVNLSLASVIVN